MGTLMNMVIKHETETTTLRSDRTHMSKRWVQESGKACVRSTNYQRFCSILSPMFQLLQSTKKINQVCVKHMKSA